MNNDLISRAALFKAWDSLDETQDANLLIDAMIKETQDAPAVDAEPVRHGLWGECRITGYDGLHAVYTRQCSECGHESRFITRYCPVCGARMDAEVKE